MTYSDLSLGPSPMTAHPSPDANAVVLQITGRDIWEKLDHIEKAVSGLPARVEDHETRLRSLERRANIALGGAALALSGTAGSLLSLLK